jgi:PilZ domain
MWKNLAGGKRHREARRTLNSTAWIVVDGSFALRKCTVMDISLSGAKLLTEEPAPKDFILSFSQADRRGKRCHVIWRNGSKVGVKFAS